MWGWDDLGTTNGQRFGAVCPTLKVSGGAGIHVAWDIRDNLTLIPWEVEE